VFPLVGRCGFCHQAEKSESPSVASVDADLLSRSYPSTGTSANISQLEAGKDFSEWGEEEDNVLFYELEEVQQITPFNWRLMSDGKTVEIMDLHKTCLKQEEIVRRSVFGGDQTYRAEGSLYKQLCEPTKCRVHAVKYPDEAGHELRWNPEQRIGGDKSKIQIIRPETIYNMDGQEHHFHIVCKKIGFTDLNKEEFHGCLKAARQVASAFKRTHVRFLIGRRLDGAPSEGKTFSIDVLTWDVQQKDYEDNLLKVLGNERQTPVRSIEELRGVWNSHLHASLVGL